MQRVRCPLDPQRGQLGRSVALRPGEAIYNDANGMMEGNHFFQVVWLSDKRKEDYLRRLHALDHERNPGIVRPLLVFEGNKPAEILRNHLLLNRLRDPARPIAPRSASAWLGEAIAIKDPTAAVFRPQGGSNLLIIGQQDDSALGIMTIALVGLASQHAPVEGDDLSTPGVRFLILDGTPFDSSRVGTFARVADALPHPSRIGGVRDVGEFLTDIAVEVERRTEAGDSEAGPIYLFLYDLQRFRSLRKEEDDYSFGGEEKPASPAKRLFNHLARRTRRRRPHDRLVRLLEQRQLWRSIANRSASSNSACCSK